MPRQFGKVDESAGWPNLPCCPHRHKVSVPCPPSGVWLVLTLCRACNPTTGLYCRTHRDRHMPQPVDHPETAPAGLDVQQLRAGETGGEG
jgi:hypothetical protein